LGYRQPTGSAWFVEGESGVNKPLFKKGQAHRPLWSAMAAKRFDPRPQLLTDARAFVRERTRGSARADDVELAASELATNAILHAKTQFELAVLIAPQKIRLEVTDSSPLMPAASESDQRHGLHIVASLAERWGVNEIDGGKVVWAEFDE
jgi:hypothetical protein